MKDYKKILDELRENKETARKNYSPDALKSVYGELIQKADKALQALSNEKADKLAKSVASERLNVHLGYQGLENQFQTEINSLHFDILHLSGPIESHETNPFFGK